MSAEDCMENTYYPPLPLGEGGEGQWEARRALSGPILPCADVKASRGSRLRNRRPPLLR